MKLNTTHCILHTKNCILHIAHYILHTEHILKILNILNILNTANSILHSDTHNVTFSRKASPSPPVPAKPNTLYSRGRFVYIVCWTVG